MLLPLLGSNVNTPFNLNRPSEKQQEHCWLEQNAFLCHINPVWHHSEQVKMPKAATGPLLLPPECWWEPTTCYILTDSIFQCKWGLEKNSEPSRGKAAPKAPCRGAQTTQAEPSALLSKNRHKCSARRHKRHFTRGAVTSSLLFISLCNDFMLRLQGLFFPLLCAWGRVDSTATYTLNSGWQHSIITQECNGCHMGLCSIQLFTGPAEQ